MILLFRSLRVYDTMHISRSWYYTMYILHYLDVFVDCLEGFQLPGVD